MEFGKKLQIERDGSICGAIQIEKWPKENALPVSLFTKKDLRTAAHIEVHSHEAESITMQNQLRDDRK
jgi:hypothetical protein